MLRSKRLISMGLTVLMVSAYSSGAYTGSVNALEMTKQAKMSEHVHGWFLLQVQAIRKYRIFVFCFK